MLKVVPDTFDFNASGLRQFERAQTKTGKGLLLQVKHIKPLFDNLMTGFIRDFSTPHQHIVARP